jgi:fructokinase
MSVNSSGSKVYGAGLIALDVIFSPEKATPQLWAGGTCGNVLTILAYLGWSSFPIARLTKDDAAAYIKTDFRKWDINEDFLHSQPTADTPIIVQKIKRNASGKVSHRFSWNCPDCGAWLPAFKPVLTSAAEKISQIINSPKLFFMDRVSRGSLILAKACSDKGAVVMFEPSGFGDKKLFQEALQLAHIIKYSSDRMDRVEGANSVLLEIQTLGEEGIRYRCNLSKCKTKGWQELKALQVTNVKDAAGAGDWCSAGILDKVAKNGLKQLKGISSKALHNALTYGQALAAWNCQFEGARGGMYSEKKEDFTASVKKILEGTHLTPEKEQFNDGFQKVFSCLCKSCRQRKY